MIKHALFFQRGLIVTLKRRFKISADLGPLVYKTKACEASLSTLHATGDEGTSMN